MDEDEKTEVGKIYKKKRVLDEDEYVEMLEKIIERDFFPEIPKLRRQAMVRRHWISNWSVADFIPTTVVAEYDVEKGSRRSTT